MALCRCKNHKPTVLEYTHYVEPIGYPETSSICGRKKCSEAGLIWLKVDNKKNIDEVADFNREVSIFQYATNVTKVKVKKNLNKI